MGWTILKERGGDEVREFKRAAMMVKEGIERMCELAERMVSQYGERGHDVVRGEYNERYREREEDGYGDRRRY